MMPNIKRRLDDIIRLLREILRVLARLIPRPSHHLAFYDERHRRIMSLTLDTTQQAPVTAAAVDASGEPSTDLVLPVSWASSDDTIATVTVDGADSTQATVMSVAAGDVTITASAANNEGSTLTGTLAVTVTEAAGNPSVGLTITPGEPVAKQ